MSKHKIYEIREFGRNIVQTFRLTKLGVCNFSDDAAMKQSNPHYTVIILLPI